MIETRLLNYFLAIAREENITKAATSLHISQPALSKQMAELEKQLGTKLFIRGNKNTTLTEDGILFRKRAQEIINLMEKTETEINGEQSEISGDIYLGCGETYIMEHIIQIFKEINDEYPDIHFHIYSGNAESVVERLDKGLLDAGLLLGSLNNEKYDERKLKWHDKFGLLMPKKCDLAKKDFITSEDLLHIPLITTQQTITHNASIRWLDDIRNQLNIIGTYNLIYNATFMVEHGIGYALCLENLVDLDGKRNLTFRPFIPETTIDAYLVTKKYQVPSSAVRLFLRKL